MGLLFYNTFSTFLFCCTNFVLQFSELHHCVVHILRGRSTRRFWTSTRSIRSTCWAKLWAKTVYTVFKNNSYTHFCSWLCFFLFYLQKFSVEYMFPKVRQYKADIELHSCHIAQIRRRYGSNRLKLSFLAVYICYRETFIVASERLALLEVCKDNELIIGPGSDCRSDFRLIDCRWCTFYRLAKFGGVPFLPREHMRGRSWES